VGQDFETNKAGPDFSGLFFFMRCKKKLGFPLRSTIASPHRPISKVVSGPQGKTVENQRVVGLDRAGLRGNPKVTRYLTFGGAYSGNT
jgi:hypothetical protein